MSSQRAAQELLPALVARDPAGYEKLMSLYGPRVLSTVKRYLVSEADAADCFQETFVTVFEKIDTFESRSSLWTWIRAIAINQCLMKLRVQKRRREQPIDELLPEYDDKGRRLVSPSPAFVDADQAIEADQVKAYVRRAIDRLPEGYRIVLLLRDIEDHSAKEVAAMLGIREDAVKVRLHRARQALRTLLEPALRRGAWRD